MANKTLFKSLKRLLPRAAAINRAGGTAYALPPKHALAQLAATGCFNNTFYSQGEDQLAELIATRGFVHDNCDAGTFISFAGGVVLKRSPVLP